MPLDHLQCLFADSGVARLLSSTVSTYSFGVHRGKAFVRFVCSASATASINTSPLPPSCVLPLRHCIVLSQPVSKTQYTDIAQASHLPAHQYRTYILPSWQARTTLRCIRCCERRRFKPRPGLPIGPQPLTLRLPPPLLRNAPSLLEYAVYTAQATTRLKSLVPPMAQLSLTTTERAISQARQAPATEGLTPQDEHYGSKFSRNRLV